jgi:hypothetical protein
VSDQSRPPLRPEDLDKLRDDIAEARRERERKEREFQSFVSSFRDAPPAPSVPEPVRATLPYPDREPLAEPVRETPKGGSVKTLGVVIGVAVLILAWAWWPGGEVVAPEGESAPTAGSQPSPTEPPPVDPAVPAPVPAPAEPAAPLTVEITTERPVWMRVTVDDQRLFEREVPGGEKIPVRADRRVIIRAGDAGGVRLVVNGQDEGRLGGDGQVVTRTFSAPSQPAR